MQYVTFPMVSNMVFDSTFPGSLARSYRAFEWLPNQTLGAEISVTLAGLAPGISVYGSAGHTYTIQFKNSLTNTNWQTLTNVNLATPSAIVFDPGTFEGQRRFYRAVTSF